ncbi:methyltransferase, FxLD system [Actinomadura keratinilytica]|uniref:Protein-L-isoaspartate O-methyltransferase n=1 Tax=Actinomadura keratinilytica TaxID=547461 RepID=A0ABP7ZH56_9ACTN
MSTDTIRPDAALQGLVDRLVDTGAIRTPAIEAAFRAVPRHRFLPGTPIADAYADRIVVTKRGDDGAPLSSASQPTIVARMLEQARPRPGWRVLEIGAGTGYNAALLRELVGGTGQVTTIDIDEGVAADARRNLAGAGYLDVLVLAGDGALGAPEHAPFDLIIVTAGAWDIPTAWWAQLAPAGRIVVPLRWRGLTRSLALDHQPAGPGRAASLTSSSMHLCGFIAMTGGSDGERTIELADDVVVFADRDQSIGGRLRGVLDTPRVEAWSDVVIPGDQSMEGIWLRMSTAEAGTCRIKAAPSAVRSGRATPATPVNPALAAEDSIAYLASRRVAEGVSRWEVGAIGHGPRGADLADRIIDQIRRWAEEPDAQPTITLYPAGTPDEQMIDGLIIDKRDSRMVFTW